MLLCKIKFEKAEKLPRTLKKSIQYFVSSNVINGEICQIRNNFLMRTCFRFWQIAQRSKFLDFAKLPVLLEKWWMRKFFRFGKITWCGLFADFEKLCPKEEFFRISKNCQFACFTKKLPNEEFFRNLENSRIASKSIRPNRLRFNSHVESYCGPRCGQLEVSRTCRIDLGTSIFLFDHSTPNLTATSSVGASVQLISYDYCPLGPPIQ